MEKDLEKSMEKMENGNWKRLNMEKNLEKGHGKWKLEKDLEIYVYECVTMYSLYKFT